MKKTIAILTVIGLIASCSLIGLNMKHKAHNKPAKYPKFTEKDSLRGFLNDYRSCFDVTFYDLDIIFNIPEKSLKGTVDIHLTAKRDLKTIQLDLYENMNIHKIEFEEKELSYTRKFDAVFIEFNRKIEANEILKLSVQYSGKPQKAKKAPWDGGTVWKKDKAGNPWCGVACELDGASLWWPLKDHLSDEPDSAQMSFTVPKGLFCVSNGRLIERKVVNTDQEQFTWKVRSPINHYNISYYIGNYVTFSVPYTRGDETFELAYYVLPENLQKAESHFKQANDMIRFYENVFGEYQWFNDGYKLVESPYAGMEHQSAIAYGNGYKNNFDGFDYIILHETAHEWWGNSVSVGDFADIWLHEGFATYSEALYVEATKGYDAYLNYLYWYGMMVKNKKPMVGPRDVKYWTYKDGDPYVKGAMTLHSLRTTIDNDSVFFDILKSFHEDNQRQIVTSQDFIDLVNLKTKNDYQWFFNQFLYNHKPAKFTYALTLDEANHQQILNFRWTDVNADFKMPIDIKIGHKLKRIYPTVKNQQIKIPYTRTKIFIDKKNFYTGTEELSNKAYLKLDKP